ncbi:hypothetical protein C9374_009557 [Naegleria lovaniensis]|uniref:Guanylate cyclase domain-containing protein n=1 Tax=Naegleria lovaniensis TaxID=51637 RepID=A0AA88KX14_NAELO|nr:uncharacterized protein C9374_009557 [Naegleria lovaniensis]KAG2392980.1 hypothetical protein C9374_009557 [Naegleria lovaniensis]
MSTTLQPTTDKISSTTSPTSHPQHDKVVINDSSTTSNKPYQDLPTTCASSPLSDTGTGSVEAHQLARSVQTSSSTTKLNKNIGNDKDQEQRCSSSGHAADHDGKSLSSSVDVVVGKHYSWFWKVLKWPPQCITIMNVILMLFILQGLFGLFSSFILLYTTGDNIVQRSIAKQKLQMNLVMDYELSDLIKTTSLAINQVLYQVPDINLNDNQSWVKLFDNLKKLYQYKLPIQISYFGRFDQSMIGLELTYVRIFHKAQKAGNFTRPVTDYHVINDIDNILAPSNIKASYYSSVDMTARPWYKPFVNATNPKILWSPFFYSALSLYPSIAACIPVYINNTISSLTANYSNAPIYSSYAAPRIPSNLFGVIGIQINVKNISDILSESALRAGIAASFIINSQGQMVAATKFLGYPALQNDSDSIMNKLVNETVSRGFLQQISAWKNAPNNQQLRGLAIKEAGSFTFQTGKTPTLDVVLFTITDQYGLNWGSVIAVPQRVFVEEVFQSSISSVVIFAVVLFLGLIIIISVVQCIQLGLRGIKRQLKELVSGNFSLVSLDKKIPMGFSLLYDIRQMQQSLNTMRAGLSIFSKYVPDIIAKKFVGETTLSRNMSILVMDIHSFTLLAEKTDRVSFISLSTDLFSEIYEIIENNKGSIDKYVGNRVVALWNGPNTCVQDHETLACNAAVQIVHCLNRLNSRWRKFNFPSIRFGLSVNSGGKILAGNIGGSSRINITVVGDDANVASGLAKLNNKFGTQILIGHNTFEKVKDQMVCYFVDHVALEGKKQPTRIYSVESTIKDATENQLKLRQASKEIEQCFFTRDFLQISEICSTLEKHGHVTPILEHWKAKASLLLNTSPLTDMDSVLHQASAQQ